MDRLVEGIGWYIVFLLSLVAHEAAHSFTAWKLGDPTAREGGQVTLNPYPHMRREPVGTILVPILSYIVGGWMLGWGSAPYDPEWAKRNPGKATLMSFAGPAVNLILVLMASAVIRVGMAAGFFDSPQTLYFSHIVQAVSPGRMDTVAFLVSVIFSLNLLLFIFNMLPIPPLDGSGVYRLLRRDIGEKFGSFLRSPFAYFGGIVVAWKVVDLIYPKIQDLAIELLYPGVIYR
jgi:Zn-dependent protease